MVSIRKWKIAGITIRKWRTRGNKIGNKFGNGEQEEGKLETQSEMLSVTKPPRGS